VTFAFPFALEAIGWKTYMINASWDVLEVLFIIFIWVETSNKTLEEIDEVIEGEMHSDAPKLMAVIAGDVEVNADSVLSKHPAAVKETMSKQAVVSEVATD
jgi:hypothetical protein